MKKFLALALALMLMLSSTAFALDVSGKKVSDGLIRIRDNKKYGYMDTDGNVIISAQYIGGEDFSNGLAPVQYSSGGFARWKYIDTAGKTVIDNIDTSKRYYDFHEWQGDYGMVTVWTIGKKNGDTVIEPLAYNYINEQGKLIYDGEDLRSISLFSEGYACVASGNSTGKLTRSSSGSIKQLGSFSGNDFTVAATKYFFIDKNGDMLGSNTWSKASSFSNGFAPVALTGADGTDMWGFVDTTGELAVVPMWNQVRNFSNGLAVVYDGAKYGAVDTNGNIVVPCQWEMLTNFTESGLAAAKIDGKYGYIDMAGNVVIEPQFKYAHDFINDTAVVSDGISYGVIDREGNYIIYPSYKYISRLGELYVCTEFDKPVIVNENGELITALLINGELPTEDQLAKYPDGTVCKLIEVPLENANGMTLKMFHDENGNSISMNMYSEIPGTEFTVVTGSGLKNVLNAQGDPISNEKWTDVNISASTSNCICVVKNNFYGYINAQGEYLLQPQFSTVNGFHNGVALVFMGQNMRVIDENGQSILPTIRKGSPKADVQRLQQALIDQGFLNDKADGAFGGKTEAAIRAAQEFFGMEVTGVADSAFQNALFK